MKLNKFTAATLLAFSASAAAYSSQLIENYCASTVWLTLSVNVTDGTTTTIELVSGQAYVSNITGEGNTAIISNGSNIYAPDVGKITLGTSNSENEVFWSVSNSSGDPLMGQYFNVTAEGSSAGQPCINAIGYDGVVHECDDPTSLIMYLC